MVNQALHGCSRLLGHAHAGHGSSLLQRTDHQIAQVSENVFAFRADMNKLIRTFNASCCCC